MKESQEQKTSCKTKRDEDSSAGLMDMMRNLYEEGDDDMIGFLWKTQHKRDD
jgi:hypothetical protein